jgi:hypothetical protein
MRWAGKLLGPFFLAAIATIAFSYLQVCQADQAGVAFPGTGGQRFL